MNVSILETIHRYQVSIVYNKNTYEAIIESILSKESVKKSYIIKDLKMNGELLENNAIIEIIKDILITEFCNSRK